MTSKWNQIKRGLQIAWYWLIQPVALVAMLLVFILVQPSVHALVGWMGALEDREAFERLSESTMVETLVYKSTDYLTGLVPIDSIAAIGKASPAQSDVQGEGAEAGKEDPALALDPSPASATPATPAPPADSGDAADAGVESESAVAEEADAAPEAPPLDPREVALRLRLESCRTEITNALAKEITSTIRTFVRDAPRYITSREKTELDLQIEMDGVRQTIAVCGTGIGDTFVDFVQLRLAKLASSQLRDFLAQPETLAQLNDPEQAAATLTTLADSLDAQRAKWLSQVQLTASALRQAERVAALRGLVQIEEGKAPPSQVLGDTVEAIDRVHDDATDELRMLGAALPEDADVAEAIASQFERRLQEGGGALVETYGRQYLNSLLDATPMKPVRLLEVRSALIAILLPIRQSYQSFYHSLGTLLWAMGLFLVVAIVVAWDLRKASAWLLAALLGTALLCEMIALFTRQILTLPLQWWYPASLTWGFFERLTAISGTHPRNAAFGYLLAACGVLALTLAIRLWRRRMIARTPVPLRPYLDPLLPPDRPLNVLDLFAVPHAIFEARVPRKGRVATPAEVRLRRRIAGAMALDYLLMALVFLGLILSVELLGGLFFTLPWVEDYVEPAIVSRILGFLEGVVLALLLAGYWIGRDTVILVWPRGGRWLDTAAWVGLIRESGDAPRSRFVRLLLRLPVPIVTVILAVLLPYSGGVSAVLLVMFCLEVAVLVLRAHTGSLSDTLSGYRLSEPPAPEDMVAMTQSRLTPVATSPNTTANTD